MATFELTIAAPPRAVFDYVVDPLNRPEWQASLRGVTVLDAGTVGVGTRWIDHTAVGAKPQLRITEMRAPSAPSDPSDPSDPSTPGVWQEVGHWHGLGVELTLWFEPAPRPASTLLRGSLELRGGKAWLPARLVLQALAPAAVRSDLRRAARILESRGQRGSA